MKKTGTVICPKCEGKGRIPDSNFIAAEMKKLRLNFGISLRQVALKMGYSAPYLVDLEAGRRNWTPAKTECYISAVDSIRKQQEPD